MRLLTLLPALCLFPCLALSQDSREKESASSLGELKKNLPGTISQWKEMSTRDYARAPLGKIYAGDARAILWQHHAGLIRKERAKEMESKQLKEGDFPMPFEFKVFGEKPKEGRSLWISLHGGGGAPAKVNDQQWQNQIRLYAPKEGIYLAPRAPTNTWNLWHQAHIDKLFARLIENLIVLEEVNPDKVYLLGYSAGGDGVYQMAPRMADSWAASAMMAGHPNGVSLLSLRNVPFSLQVGANDAAYNRNKVGQEYGDLLQKWHKDDPDGYQNLVKIREGMGHWMKGEDKDALPWMAQFKRNPIPEKVVWMQTGVPYARSYWLAVPPGQEKLGTSVTATRKGQTIQILQVTGINKLIIRLNEAMADLDKEIEIQYKGKSLFRGLAKRTMQTMIQTLDGRGDPGLIFDAQVEVNIPPS